MENYLVSNGVKKVNLNLALSGFTKSEKANQNHYRLKWCDSR